MKKLLLFTLFLMCFTVIKAQNIQILHGISSEKSYVNWATFELYKVLDKGPLYYFTDFKMSKNGYFESYSEISKYWYISRNRLALTAQYNAGLNKDFLIQPVYLGGISKAFKFGDNFELSFDVLYRYQKELILENEKANGYQVTMIFAENLDKIQISGYCDYWNFRYYMFEPQVWYKVANRLCAGLEFRISNYSLLEEYSNYAMIGIKWNLE